MSPVNDHFNMVLMGADKTVLLKRSFLQSLSVTLRGSFALLFLRLKLFSSRWTRVFEADLDDTIYLSQLSKLASAGTLPEIAWSGQIS